MSTLSSDFHHYRSISGTPGIYIGGKEPFASSLGLFVLNLQRTGSMPLEVFLTDSNYAPKFVLRGGNVFPYTSAASTPSAAAGAAVPPPPRAVP